ncbi:MAG: hypothetical protein ACI8QZ_001261 [Chlamydiales bacterium]|jgi:hypothetical protein
MLVASRGIHRSRHSYMQPSPRVQRVLLPILVAGLPIACNDAMSPGPRTNVMGPVGQRPDGSTFLVEQNFGGNAQELHLAALHWGRLVEVFGLDGQGNSIGMQKEFVIAGGLVDDPSRYQLQTNPITGVESLTILRNVNDPTGRSEFFNLLRQAEVNLAPIFDHGIGSSGLFTMVPRNSVLILTFDDLLDSRLASQETVHVRTGAPTVDHFEARVFPDLNHGDLVDLDGDGTLDFYTTRLVIDPTISEFEAFGQNPPLPVNGLGFPPSASVNVANIQLRIPTREDASFGQEVILRNPSGSALSVAENGSADLGSPTQDVLRAMRSGGPENVTADPHNGFLRDDVVPCLLGQQRVFIETPPVQDAQDENVFTIRAMRFDSTTCAVAPGIGDVLQQDLVYAEVIEDAVFPNDGVATGVRVRLLGFPDNPAWPAAWSGTALGAATYSTVYDAISGPPAACYVRFSPPPPVADRPDRDLGVNVTSGLRFSEVMDPASLSPFDSITLTRVAQPTRSVDLVVGQIARSQDLRSFTFVPSFNLDHDVGSGEDYFLTFAAGAGGPRDLAGNPLEVALPQVRFELAPDQPTHRSGGRITRFSAPDEDEPIGDDTQSLPEWTGQHVYDVEAGLIRPRAVSRFQVPVDPSQRIIAPMTPFPSGIQTPLSPFGSRMTHIYRYLDVGMDLRDATNYNIDVEGLHWAPALGIVTADVFPEYQMRLAHSDRAPDESTQGQTGCLRFPSSGVVRDYSMQVLTPEVSPMKLVHPRERGYVVDPGDGFLTSSGRLVMPWPMNRDLSHEVITYTWRDTGISGRGGKNNGGVDPFSVIPVGLPRDVMYSTLNIQTVGLPLLIEHRCYPAAADALGNNSLEIVLASPAFRKPIYRTFSTGGFAPDGSVVTIDPDLEEVANGGYNPANGGQSTPSTDPTIYLGAMDFVVRISRSVSVWFAAVDPGGGFFTAPRFDYPLTDPSPVDQPSGTSLDLAFRGAVTITDRGAPGADPRFNANTIDAYGNHYVDLDGTRDLKYSNTTIDFLGRTDDWRALEAPGNDNPTGIDGSRYYQVRLTFRSNIANGLLPHLSALAMSWE